MYTPDKDYQHMHDKLNILRKQKNISKYALAKATGMSTSSMSNLLNGKTKPYLYNMLLICNVLQVPLGELLEKDNYENEEWLISAYRTMSPEKQRMLQICYYITIEKCKELLLLKHYIITIHFKK